MAKICTLGVRELNIVCPEGRVRCALAATGLDKVMEIHATLDAPGRDSQRPCLDTESAGRASGNRNSWNVAYFSDCHDMDWRGTAWVGPNCAPYRTDCSGMRF